MTSQALEYDVIYMHQVKV